MYLDVGDSFLSDVCMSKTELAEGNLIVIGKELTMSYKSSDNSLWLLTIKSNGSNM